MSKWQFVVLSDVNYAAMEYPYNNRVMKASPLFNILIMTTRNLWEYILAWMPKMQQPGYQQMEKAKKIGIATEKFLVLQVKGWGNWFI